MRKITSVVGISLFGLGSSLVSMPANAASLADCGTAPSGGTLSFSNNVCTLKFDSDGSYTFITPSVLSGLSAVISGAGGGAQVNNLNGTGYAGNGGKVLYADLANTPANEMILIVVGDGGTSGTTPTAGADTGITYNGGLTNVEADGGAAGSIDNGYCALSGSYSIYVGFGIGASGNPGSGPNDTCVYSRGVNPSLNHADSNAVARNLAALANYNSELGKGGSLVDSANGQLPALKSGAGASVRMNTSTSTPVGNDAKGGDGIAVFRWSVGSSDSLANTGSESTNLLTLAGGAIAAGAILMAARSRSKGRHRA